ncbi:MAG: NAD(+) diphosphatase [Bacillota bacterium]|nr:NAD(+) diphosphatase [Bacillota bacterium]
MHTEGIYKRYIPGVIPPKDRSDEDTFFVFYADKLLVKLADGKAMIPVVKDIKDLGLTCHHEQYLGIFESSHCYVAEALSEAKLQGDFYFKDLRSLFGHLDEDIFILAGKAIQILAWNQTHQFCGKCGSKTVTKEGERAKICPQCGFFTYPRISPAIITAVIRDGKILLAHSKNFKSNMYSVIAGFVEPGETLEECVKREVMEEVGIRVKNIKYFGSEPWPFPNSLMVGFTSEYESGEISVDGIEIDDARWYGIENLPEIPTRISISRKLIDCFIETQRK